MHMNSKENTAENYSPTVLETAHSSTKRVLYPYKPKNWDQTWANSTKTDQGVHSATHPAVLDTSPGK